jgi:hypothetical protein
MGLRYMNTVLVFLAALAALPAKAAETGSFTAEYEGFSHGLLVLKMSTALTLTPTSYTGRLEYHTAGMIGWMVHNTNDTTVTGRLEGDRLIPIRSDSTGDLRHVDRVTRMHYDHGTWVFETLTPPVDQERSAVPPAMTVNTIDTLSAIAMLIHQVGAHGTCDGKVTAFDGRRLTALTARTVGDVMLPKTDRSRFAGQALRCDFDGDQLAGFLKSDPEAQQRRTRHGTAWLAQAVPGAPPVPVRVVFENKIMGQVTLYLTSISGAGGPVASK